MTFDVCIMEHILFLLHSAVSNTTVRDLLFCFGIQVSGTWGGHIKASKLATENPGFHNRLCLVLLAVGVWAA